MSSKAMSLKGRIKNYAKSNHIAAQVVLQNFMFERFLARLSQSEYSQKFVIKGGMLVAAIVGLDTRSTMDLDATLRNYPLSDESILAAVKDICALDLQDDVVFEVRSISPIRDNDRYGGFCVKLEAVYDTIITPLSIDISTGDIITPAAVEYEFGSIFDENARIRLWGYNIETVLAEKAETILSRSVFTTRPRDYYDIYILTTTQKYDKQLFRSALVATAAHRNSTVAISDIHSILVRIAGSENLAQMWGKYQKKFEYAKDISFSDVIAVLTQLLEE